MFQSSLHSLLLSNVMRIQAGLWFSKLDITICPKRNFSRVKMLAKTWCGPVPTSSCPQARLDLCVLWWLIKLIVTRIFQGPSCVLRYGSELLFSYFSGAWVQIVTLCKIVIALCKKPFVNVAQRSSNSSIKGQSFIECVILTKLHIVWSVNGGTVETFQEPAAVFPSLTDHMVRTYLDSLENFF